MDRLQKILSELEKPELSFSADLSIKSKIYRVILSQAFSGSLSAFSHNGLLLKRSLASVTIIALISGGTSFYAYGSQEVTQGDMLFPLKQTVEGAEKIISITPASKARTFEKISQRRLEESLVISAKKDVKKTSMARPEDKKKEDENIKKSLDAAISSLNSAAIEIKKIKDKDETKDIIMQIKESEPEHMEILDEIQRQAGEEKNEEIIEKIDEARAALEDYGIFLDEEEIKADEDDDGSDDREADKQDPSDSGRFEDQRIESGSDGQREYRDQEDDRESSRD